MADDKRIPDLPQITNSSGGMKIPIWNPATDVTSHIDLSDLLPEVAEESNEWDPDFTYMEDDIAVFEDQLYISLQDNNLDNLPSDPGSLFWVIGVKSPSGLVPYEAGIFTQEHVTVLKERSPGMWALYYLVDPARPYNSTNFATELAAGDWEFVGEMVIADIPGLQAALDAKLDIADYNDYFLGRFISLVALQTAYPTANVGEYAQVDPGAGNDVVNYSWDEDEGWVAGGSGSGASTTDALPEGSTNLYFTTARVLATLLTGLNNALTGTPVGTDSILVAFGKVANFIGNIFTTAHTWTLQQTFTLAPRFSSTTASQVLEVDSNKDLVSAAKGTAYNKDFASDAETITGTSTVKPIQPANLAAWWTNIKTLAITFTSNIIAKQFGSTIQTLTDAATVAWDGALGQNAVVTIAGNRTLGAISNPVNGVVYTIRVIQDATGNRTLAYNAAYLFNNSINALIDRRANGWTVLRFRYDGTNFVYLDNNDEEGVIDLGNLTGAVSIDLSLGRKFKCAQTGNWTSFTFTNEIIGRSYTLDITRTSNYTLALTASKFRLPLGIVPTLTDPTTNGVGTSVDKLCFECAVASRLDLVITPDLQNN